MTTATKNLESSTPTLKPGDVVHFYGTTSLLRDGLMFSTPVITSFGSEVVLTEQMLAAYEYPQRESWLTRIGQPDRNGFVLTGYGPWPEGDLKTLPGSPERKLERDAALSEIWAEFGPQHSKVKADALAALDKKFGPQSDSWTAANAAWVER